MGKVLNAVVTNLSIVIFECRQYRVYIVFPSFNVKLEELPGILSVKMNLNYSII